MSRPLKLQPSDIRSSSRQWNQTTKEHLEGINTSTRGCVDDPLMQVKRKQYAWHPIAISLWVRCNLHMSIVASGLSQFAVMGVGSSASSPKFEFTCPSTLTGGLNQERRFPIFAKGTRRHSTQLSVLNFSAFDVSFLWEFCYFLSGGLQADQSMAFGVPPGEDEEAWKPYYAQSI